MENGKQSHEWMSILSVCTVSSNRYQHGKNCEKEANEQKFVVKEIHIKMSFIS